MAKSRTSAQVIVDEVTGELDFTPWTTTFTFEKSRRMRLDPTLQMARLYSVAPILAASWTVEGDEEEHIKLIKDQLLPLRTHLLSTYLFSEIDFGWKCYEKIFAIDEQGTTVIQEVKPLKCDDTRVRYDKNTGAFKGLRTSDLYTGQDVFIDAQHSLFVNFDEEGLGNYAIAGFQIAEKAYDDWNTCNRAAVKYDDKVAGVYLVVWHPEGKTKLNGVETDNGEIAQTIIRTLRASGSVSIPIRVKNQIDQLNGFQSSKVWEVAFLNPGQMQGAFNERANYLDKLKARALGVTERSLFEGTYGTKAEAVTHASAVMLCKMLKHVQVTDYFNTRLVDQLLWQNFHAKGTAKLVAQPLTDDRIELFTRVFESLLSDPAAGLELKDAIDKKQLLESLRIPLEEGADFDRAARDLPPADEDQPTKTVTETTKTQFSFYGTRDGIRGKGDGPGGGDGGGDDYQKISLSKFEGRTGTSTDVGPIEVTAYRVGPTADRGRGTFFADSLESIEDYKSLHDGHEPKKYTVKAEKPIVTESQFTLWKALGNKDTLQDAVWRADKASGFASSIAAFEKMEAKMAKQAAKLGHDAIVYTKPPAPAKVEIAVIKSSKKTSSFTELSHLNLTRDGIRGKGDGPGGGSEEKPLNDKEINKLSKYLNSGARLNPAQKTELKQLQKRWKAELERQKQGPDVSKEAAKLAKAGVKHSLEKLDSAATKAGTSMFGKSSSGLVKNKINSVVVKKLSSMKGTVDEYAYVFFPSTGKGKDVSSQKFSEADDSWKDKDGNTYVYNDGSVLVLK